MQGVAEIVGRQAVFHAVQGELALVDAVGIAADGGAVVGLIVLGIVVLDLVKSQDHVPLHAVLVRHDERRDAAAVVGDGHLHPGIVVKLVHTVSLRRTGGRSEGAERKQNGFSSFHIV